MNILHPSKTVLGIPNMGKSNIEDAEVIFRDRLKRVITCSFKEDGLQTLVRELKSAIENHDFNEQQNLDNFIDFNKRILLEMPKYIGDTTKPEYFDVFKKAHHARVKTQDDYRIVNAVSIERQVALKELYEHFSKYTSDDVPSLIHQASLKIFYKFLSEMTKGDWGISEGMHPWESSPPITMHAIEYILVTELEEAFNSQQGNLKAIYCNTLLSNGIKSNSWERVRVNENRLHWLSKLKACGTSSKHSSNLNELVRNRYISGLQKLGEYNAWIKCLGYFNPNFNHFYTPDILIKETGV